MCQTGTARAASMRRRPCAFETTTARQAKQETLLRVETKVPGTKNGRNGFLMALFGPRFEGRRVKLYHGEK